jgi:hypothetical protein
MKYVAQASKNTSVLPDKLKDVRTSDDMKAVLRIVAEKEDFARQLAKGILGSTDAAGVNNAFAAIAEAAATAGVQDPEELLRIKLDQQVRKYVGEAILRIGDIKSTFKTAANAATST